MAGRHLTEKEEQEAQREFLEIIDWAAEQVKVRMQELKDTNKWIGGLDTHKEDYKNIYDERDRRIMELKKRYNIE